MGRIFLEDTIAAIATPVGEGGIAVIRVSGPDAWKIAASVFYPQSGRDAKTFASHTIHFGQICDADGKILDQVLASFFRAPNSYTGEDAIEISAHGGIVVTKKILNLLIKNGARHAEPGEFTKRAFLSGRIDLTQAEAVLDLIKSKSERSLDLAVKQLAGSLSKKLKGLKDVLMKLYAHVEASIDFPEEDIEVYTDDDLAAKFSEIENEISQLIASFSRASLLREGIVAVIVGKPNVGKSSLFNALLERDRALVSPYPGTTRDHLEEALEIQGVSIRLIDTAGLGGTPDHPLDRMGMERSRQALRSADLLLYVVDGSASLEEADAHVFKEINLGKPVLVVVNKCDLPPQLDQNKLKALIGGCERLSISTATREGFEILEAKIIELIFGKNLETGSEQITRLRHKNALESAQAALRRAQESFLGQASLEFVALDLKAALDAISELVGETYSEDLLDVIFSEFCIGK